MFDLPESTAFCVRGEAAFDLSGTGFSVCPKDTCCSWAGICEGTFGRSFSNVKASEGPMTVRSSSMGSVTSFCLSGMRDAASHFSSRISILRILSDSRTASPCISTSSCAALISAPHSEGSLTSSFTIRLSEFSGVISVISL